jgi:cyanate lyase
VRVLPFLFHGPTLQALVHEEFDDGILNGFNFKVRIDESRIRWRHHAVILLDGK